MELGSFTLGTLFGILIASLINHFLAKIRASESRKQQQKYSAASDLRKAFTNELLALHPNRHRNEEDLYNVLLEALPKHQIAVEEFAVHLSSEKKEDFMAAWYEYSHYEGLADSPEYLEQYSRYGISISEYEEACELAISRIKKLLSYASK